MINRKQKDNPSFRSITNYYNTFLNSQKALTIFHVCIPDNKTNIYKIQFSFPFKEHISMSIIFTPFLGHSYLDLFSYQEAH